MPDERKVVFWGETNTKNTNSGDQKIQHTVPRAGSPTDRPARLGRGTPGHRRDIPRGEVDGLVGG